MTVGKAKSLCLVCLRMLDAKKCTRRGGNIYPKKRCPEHGEFSVFIWEGDVESHARWGRWCGDSLLKKSRRRVMLYA